MEFKHLSISFDNQKRQETFAKTVGEKHICNELKSKSFRCKIDQTPDQTNKVYKKESIGVDFLAKIVLVRYRGIF